MGVVVKERAQAVLPPGTGTAAELYQVQPHYQRFNQKYNITRQRLWNPAVAELEKRRQANLRALVAEGHPGYDPIDVALNQGAMANLTNTGFPINYANQQGNS